MKTVKIMSIVGLVLFSLSFICLIAFNNYVDYEAAIGWGIYAALYGISLSIVALVHAKRHSKKI